MRGEQRQVRVSLRVVPDHVPVLNLAARRGAEVALHLADREEGCVDVETLEYVEHFRRVRARTVVEGQGDVFRAAAADPDKWGVGEHPADRGVPFDLQVVWGGGS